MKIYTKTLLSQFDFWGGAADIAEYLTANEFDDIELQLEELYPDGMDETELNDFFWFEPNTIAEMLGYSDFGEIMNREE